MKAQKRKILFLTTHQKHMPRNAKNIKFVFLLPNHTSISLPLAQEINHDAKVHYVS